MMSQGTQKSRPNTAEAGVGDDTEYYDIMDNPIFAKDYDEKVEREESIKEAERLTLEMQGAAKRKLLVSSVRADLTKTYGELNDAYIGNRIAMIGQLIHE
eukprot:12942095-Heterocapsa_arctica.AAC.1